MNLPNIILDLIAAQSNFDSKAYAKCFSESALVFDENETHKGQNEIKKWNEKTNEMYQTQLEVLDFLIADTTIVKTKVSGNFEGSPIILKYHFELKDGKIDSLKITV
ncbi:nuclear transport factor 2 family protein [Flavobacterium psychroterrae]|jgi:ketosteroid isomerase-like protein|uniref:Nuclear transport factor 2 family protein n=1 Tax=Flavobacterium psychroterrae TaxID=2133767 RepID=A0ABS5PAB7_9FLAO|nr:nuclear transport factor 2 family protein [Flavobacterium psychroterrae]MBS7231219.1 nuclear transport factor 2 family protein [Flavobacterium psychroterrae]